MYHQGKASLYVHARLCGTNMPIGIHTLWEASSFSYSYIYFDLQPSHSHIYPSSVLATPLLQLRNCHQASWFVHEVSVSTASYAVTYVAIYIVSSFTSLISESFLNWRDKIVSWMKMTALYTCGMITLFLPFMSSHTCTLLELWGHVATQGLQSAHQRIFVKTRTAMCVHLVDVIYSHSSHHVHGCSLLRGCKLLLVEACILRVGQRI